MIDEFTGRNRWLSNFFYAPITYLGFKCQTNEHAFQLAKSIIHEEQVLVAACTTPGRAKRAGRKVSLRPDWEDVKDSVMMEVTILKFINNPVLRQQLLDTGDQRLVETNKWGDIYWGVSGGFGRNQLGKILMRVREMFREV